LPNLSLQEKLVERKGTQIRKHLEVNKMASDEGKRE